MLRRMGVRGRLLLAFLGISAFALIAAAAAMYSFSEVGGVLGRITEERVPAALDSLELSRQAERIVAAAPKLLAVSSPEAQAEVSGEIAGEVARLHQLHQGLEGRVDQASLAALRGDITEMAANLERARCRRRRAPGAGAGARGGDAPRAQHRPHGAPRLGARSGADRIEARRVAACG